MSGAALRRWFVTLAAMAVLSLFTLRAGAHKPSDSYLTLTVDGATVHGRWDIAVRDLADAVALDGDGDGRLTWGELRARHDAIGAYALARLTLGSGGAPCALAADPGGHAVAVHSDGSYAVLRFTARCTAVVRSLDVDYRLLFDVDAQHRGLVRLEAGGSRTHVFSATARSATFDLGRANAAAQVALLVREGCVHIWRGYDHVLFLLALLLPSVLQRRGGAWLPATSLRTVLLDVLRIVTAFTIAHSITLSLAAFGVVTLSSRVVESVIAASVVLAAANNVAPVLGEDRWAAAFLLGLMHGFGFSSTLADLDLPRDNLILTLFGFNLGVELGQIAIVAAFVPLAYRLRRSTFYRKGMLLAGSVAILVLALVWLVERAFLVRVLP
jgi:hypothetical protein